jgi:hypothetical protein
MADDAYLVAEEQLDAASIDNDADRLAAAQVNAVGAIVSSPPSLGPRPLASSAGSPPGSRL